MLSLTLALTALLPPPGPSAGSRLAVIREAPDFALTDQDGKPVRRSDLQGKVLLVSFVFTTCNGACPATTHRMAKIQQALKDAGEWDPRRVRFLSITLDPARDSPEALRRYMQLYDLGGDGWSFLTGPPAEVAGVIEAWGMWVKPAANGQLDHPSRIFLVDPKLRVREIYNTELLRVDHVRDDIRVLLAE